MMAFLLIKYIYIRNSTGPNTHLVVHQIWLMPSCYRIGCCVPVGVDQLTSFSSIWLNRLECRLHCILALVFHMVPCQMLSKIQKYKIYRFIVVSVMCVYDFCEEIEQACQAATFVSEAMLRVKHPLGCSFPSVWLILP